MEKSDKLDEKLSIEINFTTFIFSLAQTALTYLGELHHPESGKKEVNLEIAKQNIDILGLLEHKTRGNLDIDEEKLLKSMIFDLRLKYLEAAQGTPKRI